MKIAWSVGASFFVAFFVSFQAISAPTMDQCGREYKRCKNDVANMFDKSSCKKARSRCENEAQLALQQGTMKNKMMSGTAMVEPATTLSPADRQDSTLTVRPALSAREAAEQRMKAREQAQQGATVGQGSIRGNLGGETSTSAPGINNFEKTPEQKKAEAQHRLLEREKAKASGQQPGDNFKSN